MYRKLMFLISLVVLLGLVNSASAIVWDGGGDGTSWCDSLNWDGDVLPGPADTATIMGDFGVVDVVVACDVTIDTLEGPGWDGPDNAQSLSFNSGTVLIGQYSENDMDGDEVTTYNFNGANVTIGDGDFRLANDGFAVINMTAGSLLVVSGDLRGGDNGGTGLDINVSGGNLTVDDGALSIGDDGNGTLDVSGGNVTCNGDDIVMAARDGGVTTMIVSGTGEVFAENALILGKDEPGGDAILDMEGGTLNVDEIKLHCDGGGDGTQQIIMNAGELTVRDTLGVGCDGDATVQINGGTFSVGSLEIGDDGLIDINDNPAALIIDGDAVAQVAGLFIAGKITAMGSSRAYKADFGVTNPGKTTVMFDRDFNPDLAWGPDPADGQTGVQSSISHVVLKWNPGDSFGMYHGSYHQLYFGTDAQAVEDATPSSDEYVGAVAHADEYDMGTLPLWQTFYWRVDEYVRSSPVTVVKGNVWSLTTGCEAINGDLNNDCLLNFLDYAGVAATWQQQQMWPE